MSRPRSPFEQLKTRYDEVDTRCSACGHRDDEGTWSVAATGRRVEYERVCPGCGATETRELRL